MALFVCLGAFLRVYRFWSSGIWIDESGTWWVVAQGGMVAPHGMVSVIVSVIALEQKGR